MPDQGNQLSSYKMLAVVFGVAGVVWIVYGFLSPRFILYPLIGVANLAIAFLCKQAGA
jgi:membrane-bound ClpP family serine protease